MRDNCDLMYKALSLPRGKQRPQDCCVPSLLMMTIALQIFPTASSDFSNLVGDELQICTTTQSHYQIVPTYHCQSSFQDIGMLRFRRVLGQLRTDENQSEIVPLRNAQVVLLGERLDLGPLQMLNSQEGFPFIWVYFECSSYAVDCVEQEQLPRFLQRNVFIISTASAIAMCRMQLFSRPQKQQFHHHMGKREINHEEQLHNMRNREVNQEEQLHNMRNREVNQEELAASCLCAPVIALHPSTTPAVHCTSSQSAPDRNKCSTERSRQIL